MGEGEEVKRSLLSNEKPLNIITFTLALTAFAVYCSSFAMGNATAYSSPAESGITNDLGLTLFQYSTFVSMSLIGMLSGVPWSGKFADVIGRRGGIGAPGLICISGWLCVALSKDATWLYVGMLLVGIGEGFCSYTLGLYISEITPKNIRGTIMSLAPLLLSSGKAFVFVLGPLITWRTLALLGIVPFILQLPILLCCPESPRWLMKIGREAESENVLRRLRGANVDVTPEFDEIKDFTENCKSISTDGIMSVFQRKYARSLIIGVGLLLIPQLGGLSGINFYASSIFESAGFSSSIGSVSVGLIQIISSALSLTLIDKFGRRPLLLEIHKNEKLTPVLALVGVLVYCWSFSSGMDGIPWIILSEVLPLNIKVVGGSFAIMVSLSCGCFVSYTYNSMFQWNSAGTFFIFASFSGIGVLFIWKMVPETKG